MSETPPPRQKLADHARNVSPLSWKVFAVFLVLGVAGAAAYGYAYATRPAVAHSTAAIDVPAGASGFASPKEAVGDAFAKARDSWTGWMGEHGAGLGFGFVGGFVIAFIFRAFLKIMTLVTILIVGGMAALSYYHILNIDFTAAEKVVQTNADWLTEQATRLKDVLIAHLPSSGGSAAGAYFGLRRR